jgi:signal transduction histidine kinase
MEGRRVHDVPGIDGDRFVRDAWAAAPGGGWIEYRIVNPVNGQVQDKVSWVVQVDEELIVGCGVYKTTSATGQADAAASSAPVLTRVSTTMPAPVSAPGTAPAAARPEAQAVATA